MDENYMGDFIHNWMIMDGGFVLIYRIQLLCLYNVCWFKKAPNKHMMKISTTKPLVEQGHHFAGCFDFSAWWCNSHLEKYEFVNGKDYIPYSMDNKIHVPNHQPVLYLS